MKHLFVLTNITIPVLPKSTAPGACVSKSFAAIGAADGDTLAFGVTNSLMLGGGTLQYFVWVNANNTVMVRVCNIDPNNAHNTPATGTIRIDVWKH